MFDLGHPAHVHLFKNVIWNLERDGHDVLIASRGKEILCYLLDAYGFKHHKLSERGEGLLGLARELMIREYKFYKLARQFKPDILCGVSEVITHTGRLIRKPSIVFTDTEHATHSYLITFPFASVICTPSCFKKDLGKKQVRYNGYHELAYLHPNYFQPDPSVLGEVGLKPEDRFVLMRFVAWEASHDIGQHGFDMQTKRKLVEEIGKYARVFITSESPLPSEFEKCRITTPPEKIHDLLYYAMMYIGEGATMATEAAILGTPSVYTSSLSNTMGNFVELEKEYDLIYSFREPDKAIQKATELLQQPDLKKQWAKKRQRLLADKIDVTQFMVDFIENYPQSFYRYKEESRKRL